MSSLPLYVLRLWACSVLAQVLVLVLLFLKGNFRKLPFLTSYIALNICQAGFLLTLYFLPNVGHDRSTALAWWSETVTLLAQALATSEVLAITLRPYQGIWGLGRRALTAVSAFVVLLVVLSTYGKWALSRWFELDRGYHLTFASAVIACLLLVRYYCIPVPAVYKMILGGFCFYSCTEILIDTLHQILLYRGFNVDLPVWQFCSMLSFVLVQVVWAVALWRPLPDEDRQASYGTDSSYQRLSPEINEQLRQLNEKLLRLWKLEAR
jgi:hypothetical protein